jgi:Ca2+/Na+ antiporter
MARRKKPARRRRSPKTTSLLSVAESIAVGSIATKQIFGSNLINFVLGDVVPGIGSPGGASLLEIAQNPGERLEQAAARAMNPQRIMNIAVMTFLTTTGFKFAKKALAPTTRSVNKMLRPLALGVRL